MTTSGSSGRKGLFVYGPAAWRVILAQFLRYNAMIGLRPRLPRRLRVAAIGGGSATHMTSQISASVSVGVHRILALPATMPLERLVAELNRFRPDVVNVYPSVATGLVEEQLEGRLRIAPSILSTSSELRTPELTARLSEAFGVTPFDLYATTEGLWGCECEHHRGVHLFEDTVLVENVDAEGRVVAPGEPGARLLITSLSNRTQPLIRLELPDVLTLDPEPCPCGRSLVRTRSLDGRSDDVLELPARDGGTVRVLPIEFAVVTRDRDVREFQVVQEGARLRVLVVAREGAGAALEARVGQALSERLAALGTAGAGVTVERRGELPRSPGGKLQLVVADRRAAAGTVSPASA